MQVVITCALIFVLFALIYHFLLNLDGRVWLVFWLFSSVCVSAAFVGWSAVIAARDNVALKRGEDYFDLGPGNIPLGFMKLLAEPVTYNPRPRDLRQAVTLPAREGTVLTGKANVTWQPDRTRIGVFIEQEPQARLPELLAAHLETWSKQILPGELYFASPPPPVIAGLIVTSLTLTDIAPGEGGMNRYIWDSTHLLQSIVNEIEDEDRIETKRAELKRDYPDREHRIDRLIEQRKAELRRRGLRENR